MKKQSSLLAAAILSLFLAACGDKQSTPPALAPAPAAPAAEAPAAPAADDPIAKLKKTKEMLELGLITQADYDALKAKALGL